MLWFGNKVQQKIKTQTKFESLQIAKINKKIMPNLLNSFN